MQVSKKAKWEVIIKQLKVVEDKFGSVSKAPNDSPEMIKLHILTDASNIKPSYHHCYDEKQIIKLVKRGYSATEIARNQNVSSTLIDNFLHDNLLETIPRFKWKATKGKKTYYAERLIEVGSLVGLSPQTESSQIKRYVKQAGYKIQQIRTKWFKMPIGVKYKTKDLKQWHTKTSLSSFLYSDD